VGKDIQQAFGRSIDRLGELFSFVEAFAASVSASGDDLYALKLAAEELFTNMIRHNVGGGESITVRLWRNGAVLGLEMRDYHVQVSDPESWIGADLSRSLSEKSIGGLGLHLVRSTMDELVYSYEGDTMIVRAHRQVRK